MKTRKKYVRWERRVVLGLLEHYGILLYSTYSALNRLAVWYDDGMTERELAFLKSQNAKLKDVADKLSKFRSIIYDDVKMW